MAGLQAEELSSEFLKNFLPETIFLVEGDVPVTIIPEVEATAPATITQPVTVTVTIATPAPQVKSIPAIPRLPKQEALAQPSKYNVIGENRKGVAVLVTIPDAEFRKLPQLEFL